MSFKSFDGNSDGRADDLRGIAIVPRDAMRALWNETQELIALALCDPCDLVTLFALHFDFTLYDEPLAEELAAVLTSKVLIRETHRTGSLYRGGTFCKSG